MLGSDDQYPDVHGPAPAGAAGARALNGNADEQRGAQAIAWTASPSPSLAVPASHATHLPDLTGDERVRQRIRQELLAADRAGPRSDVVEPLTASQIESPLSLAAAPVDESSTPQIRGYRIEHKISGGGQACVYGATHLVTGRRVAIKVLTRGPHASAHSHLRFEREVEVLAKLDHPRIVGILDRGRTEDGSPFLVMDYVRGADLDQYLSVCRGRGDRVRDVARLFARIAEAVHDAHRNGVVHRDLKPSNVRVDEHGEPHLLDLGLARLISSEAALGADDPAGEARSGSSPAWMHLTTTGHLVGSLPWASPEQVAPHLAVVGPRSDVYALGVMLYQALTGRHPYPVVGGIAEVTDRICRARPAPPEECQDPPFGRVDRTMARILTAGLAKRPEERYPSAAALAADLDAYAKGRRVSAARRRHPRPQRLLTAIGIAVLFIAGAGAWLMLSGALQDDPRKVVINTNLPRFTNAIGMTFVQVPSGRVSMGSWPHEDGREENEDRHAYVVTRPFFVATTEVTREQYARVMGGLPAECDPTLPGDAPVDHVTWPEAIAFCRRLSELHPTGLRYDLPAEGQWEYVCRAGTQRAFAGTGEAMSMGWYAENSGDGRLQRVGQKHANHWGLFDMHGNAAEWCRDSYRDRLGTKERVDRVIDTQQHSRVLRGGSVARQALDCRSASRIGWAVEVRRPAIGFRVVVTEPGHGGTSTRPTAE